MAERRRRIAEAPTSVMTDGHPSLMENSTEEQFPARADMIAALEETVSELRSQLHEQEQAKEQVLAAWKEREEVAMRRVAEVLRHNGELVEEKRLLEAKLRETVENYEGNAVVLPAKLDTCYNCATYVPESSIYPRRWIVRQATDDKQLETQLNFLSSGGWTIDQIYEPRGGAYRVIAWQNSTEDQNA